MKGDYATRWRQADPLSAGFINKTRSLIRKAVLSLSSEINREDGLSFLRCLYCHYVFDDQREAFERLIAKLKTIGQFVDTDTCVQMLQGMKRIDRRYFHLSFDDGFRNTFLNAVPILKKHDVPAIFFVPSSLIEANWERARNYCLETTQYRAVIEMLRWGDLLEMVSQGYEIGSHTKTHARFSSISNRELLMEEEILGSKRELEAKIQQECKYISWPFGRQVDADDESLRAVRRAGYVACFGAFRGTAVPGKTDMYRIPRHHFEVQWPISHVMYFARGNYETSE